MFLFCCLGLLTYLKMFKISGNVALLKNLVMKEKNHRVNLVYITLRYLLFAENLCKSNIFFRQLLLISSEELRSLKEFFQIFLCKVQ